MGIFSLTTFNVMAEKAVKPYWQDVQVVEVNKEYPRTSFMTYNNRADALSGKFERSYNNKTICLRIYNLPAGIFPNTCRR